MISKKFTIINEQGLHMRPAGLFAGAMTKFKSNVTIKYNGKEYNAKSIMILMSACIKCGYDIEIICDGEDENEAMEKAAEMIESGFGE